MVTLRLIEQSRSCRLFLLLLIALCAGTGKAEDAEIELNLQVESPVAVERGGGKITLVDVEAYLSGLSDDLKPIFVADSDRLGKALDDLLIQRQLRAGAEAEEEGFWEMPAFQAELIQKIEKEVARLYLEELWQREKLDDYSAQAEELYLTRPNLVRAPARYDFSHILIRHGNRRPELAAMRQIIGIFDELSKGAEFIELAESVSEDNSEIQARGKYTDVEARQLDEPVRDALAALEEGQISQPFRSGAGWHIVRLEDRSTPEYNSFEAARTTALRVAEKRHKQSFQERVLRRLTSESIRIHNDALNKLLDRYSLEAEVAEEAGSRLGESIEGAL